jgi:hypothetical protein
VKKGDRGDSVEKILSILNDDMMIREKVEEKERSTRWQQSKWISRWRSPVDQEQ